MFEFLDQVPAEYRPLALVTFVVVLGIGAVLQFRRGKKDAPPVAPAPAITHTETNVITTDSTALKALTTSIDEFNLTVIELKQLIAKELDERDFEERVQEGIEKRLDRERQRSGG